MPNHPLLIVDPDPGPSRRLGAEFGRMGFEVWGAEDVESALEVLRRDKPSIVVSELRFRDGAFSDLLVALAALDARPPLVILTSYGSVATVVSAIRSGATNYLTKPATADQVLAAIRNPTAPTAPLPHWFTLDEAIWEYINRAVEHAGSIAEAARRLGLERRSLRRMLGKYSSLRTQ
jgi:two-component system response regulator RegA